jgi:ABC-2 type transport system ATP-binding protein
VVRDRHRVRRAISLTGQYAAVDELQTGAENLRMTARLAGLGRSDARKRAAELLERFDLVDAGNRRVGAYSGGMRRRLDLAASLVGEPSVIFLDEPTTGLDVRSRQAMWDVVSELVRGGVTVFLTTQYLEEADQLADRIAVLDHGRLVADGTAARLKEQVGGQRLDLTLADPAAYDAAAAHLGDRLLLRDRRQCRARAGAARRDRPRPSRGGPVRAARRDPRRRVPGTDGDAFAGKGTGEGSSPCLAPS